MSHPADVGREGLVTVWDDGGRYLGCMGVNLWRALLESQSAAPAGAVAALEAVRRELDLPEHLAELVGEALA
jgi:hypothetical protein